MKEKDGDNHWDIDVKNDDILLCEVNEALLKWYILFNLMLAQVKSSFLLFGSLWTLKENIHFHFLLLILYYQKFFTIIWLWLFIHYYAASYVFWNKINLTTIPFYCFPYCLIFNFIWVLNCAWFYIEMRKDV